MTERGVNHRVSHSLHWYNNKGTNVLLRRISNSQQGYAYCNRYPISYAQSLFLNLVLSLHC